MPGESVIRLNIGENKNSILKNIGIRNFKDIKGSAMDENGHLFAIGRPSSKPYKLIPYYLQANKSTVRQVGKAIGVGNSIYDAATYFEYNNTKYIVAGKGFFGGAVGWRLPNSYSYGGSNWPTVNFNIDSNSVPANTKLSTVDDIAWLRDGSAWPKYNGLSPSFVGYSTQGEKVVLGYITSATSSKVNIKLTSHTLSRASGWSSTSNVGAVFAFGGEEVYAVYNNTGEVRKISYNGSSFSFGASLGNMLKNISHQWRQPLATISMSINNIKASVALEEKLEDEEILECADNVMKNGILLGCHQGMKKNELDYICQTFIKFLNIANNQN